MYWRERKQLWVFCPRSPNTPRSSVWGDGLWGETFNNILFSPLDELTSPCSPSPLPAPLFMSLLLSLCSFLSLPPTEAWFALIELYSFSNLLKSVLAVTRRSWEEEGDRERGIERENAKGREQMMERMWWVWGREGDEKEDEKKNIGSRHLFPLHFFVSAVVVLRQSPPLPKGPLLSDNTFLSPNNTHIWNSIYFHKWFIQLSWLGTL